MQSNLSFSDFLASPPGRYVLRWEQQQLNRAVVDIFGYHAIQIGVPELDALAENRMPLRLGVSDRLADENAPTGNGSDENATAGNGSDENAPTGNGSICQGPRRVAVITRYEELPFATQSIDLVVLPHILEFAQEPHQVLREVDRVLVPEGQVIITGFNPASLWGLRQMLARAGARPYLPRDGQFISLPRIKDWLKLLSFEASRGCFGCYAPWAGSERWLARWAFMEHAGDRWWPVLGSVYMLTAVKRVRGMRMIGPVRKRKEERRVALTPAPAATPRTPTAFSTRIDPQRDAANDAASDAAHG
ncbi:MAG: methyltransferase domain-containing protein [Burkholderiaceae bacterium]|nr:methyltransferase domain-containing protein [Burkholderiaceae bacterium]